MTRITDLGRSLIRQLYRYLTQRIKTSRTVLFTLLAIATTGAALPSTSASAADPGLFPAHRITSYPLHIAGIEIEADVYAPKISRWKRHEYQDSLPLLLMMQGARVNKEYYSSFAVELARHGFIVVVPNQVNQSLGGALLFADMETIPAVLQQIRKEDASPDSPIYGIADPNRMALSGHSFGGAASLFALGDWCAFPFCDPAVGYQRPVELQAAAMVSSHSGKIDLDTTGIPIAILAGTEEISLPDYRATYETLEPPRAFITVRGANHYGLCDVGEPPGSSQKEGESAQSVPQAITATRYAHWAGQFLRAHLHNDSRAYWKIYRSNGGDPDIEIDADER